jgi:hypothetical protein
MLKRARRLCRACSATWTHPTRLQSSSTQASRARLSCSGSGTVTTCSCKHACLHGLLPPAYAGGSSHPGTPSQQRLSSSPCPAPTGYGIIHDGTPLVPEGPGGVLIKKASVDGGVWLKEAPQDLTAAGVYNLQVGLSLPAFAAGRPLPRSGRGRLHGVLWRAAEGHHRAGKWPGALRQRGRLESLWDSGECLGNLWNPWKKHGTRVCT